MSFVPKAGPAEINYLTPQGFQKLRDELSLLLHTERPRVVEAVSVAAAMGDRSENAEYIYGKRRLREIDSRIRFLHKRLEKVEVINPEEVSIEKVAFGTWVEVLFDGEAESQWYQILGQDEINPTEGRITFSSPVGRALLGKRVGDVVSIQRPAGAVDLEIVTISRQRI